MIHVTKKIRIVDDPLSESSTPGRLLAGIVAGLALGIDAGDCGCCVGGFGVYAGGFFRGVGCGKVGVVRG